MSAEFSRQAHALREAFMASIILAEQAAMLPNNGLIQAQRMIAMLEEIRQDVRELRTENAAE